MLSSNVPFLIGVLIAVLLGLALRLGWPGLRGLPVRSDRADEALLVGLLLFGVVVIGAFLVTAFG